MPHWNSANYLLVLQSADYLVNLLMGFPILYSVYLAARCSYQMVSGYPQLQDQPCLLLLVSQGDGLEGQLKCAPTKEAYVGKASRQPQLTPDVRVCQPIHLASC